MTASYEGVAKLGFGAMRLPLADPDDVTAIDIEQLKAMMDEFIAKGGTYVDTAFVYHNGASETALREALVERYPRDAYTLATKCLAWACPTKEEAQACLPTSLERLGVDYIDYYLLHNLGGARTAKFDEYDMWNYVAKAKADGLVRHVGFSMHDGPETLEEILTAHPEVDFVQLQVNYLDWTTRSPSLPAAWKWPRPTACRHHHGTGARRPFGELARAWRRGAGRCRSRCEPGEPGPTASASICRACSRCSPAPPRSIRCGTTWPPSKATRR